MEDPLIALAFSFKWYLRHCLLYLMWVRSTTAVVSYPLFLWLNRMSTCSSVVEPSLKDPLWCLFLTSQTQRQTHTLSHWLASDSTIERNWYMVNITIFVCPPYIYFFTIQNLFCSLDVESCHLKKPFMVLKVQAFKPRPLCHLHCGYSIRCDLLDCNN